MARQVLPWVGAAIGMLWGQPQLGFAIGSLVGNVVDPMVLKAPSIGDGQTQSSQEGIPINRVYGTACVSGNIIARGDLKKVTKRSRQGKGGPVQEEERFLLTYAIGITHHEIGGILRIWEDDKLVYDVRPEGSQVSGEENVKYAEKFRLFLGTNDQNPSSDLEMIFGAGDTPAYRNRSYIVFPENDVTDRRGSIPIYRFEVTTSDVVFAPSLYWVNHPAQYSGFEGTPGKLEWPGINSTGWVSWGPNSGSDDSVSTSNNKFFVSACSADRIDVYRRNDDGSKSIIQTVPWDFFSNNTASSKVKIRLSRSEKWLLVYYHPAGYTNSQPRQLCVLPFDAENGVLGAEAHRYAIDQTFVSSPSPINAASTKVKADLLFSPDGSRFLLGPCWSSSTFTLLCASLNDLTGEVENVNSKASLNCHKTIGFFEQYFCWGGNNHVITGTSSPLNTIELTSYVVDRGDEEHCDPYQEYGSHRWGKVSKVSVTDNDNPWNLRASGSQIGGGLVYLPGQGNQRGIVLYPTVNVGDTEKSYPWCYFDTVNGILDDILYEYIPVNRRPDTTAAIDGTGFAASGGGEYIATVVNYSVDQKDSDVVLQLCALNRITGRHEVIQELTRKQIVDGGATVPIWNQINTFAFSGSADYAVVTGKAYLPNIVKDVADLCEPGLDQKLDVSELEGKVVEGFVIGSQVSARSVISSLQQTHFFDPAEYDEKVNFIVRGKAVSEVITEQDLVDEDPWSQLRKSSIEYPKTLNLKYQNATSGYDVAMARTIRSSSSVQVSGEKTIEVPEVMDTDRAARVSDIQMKIAWAEAAGNFTFTVPASWHDTWVPSDVLGLYLGDTPYRLRIEKIERADGELKIEASMDRQSAYSSFVTGIPVREPTPPAPTIAGEMKHVYLNMPALIDSNDVLGYYLGTSGTRPAYTGGVVERKHDGIAEDYSSVLSVGSGRTLAFLLAPITASSEHYVDTTNVLHVKVYGEDFEAFQTVSDDLFLREENGLALVNAAGEVELVQYRDAEVVAEGEYKLTHLLRGRLNTTPRAFAMNDTLAVLDDVNLVVVDGSEIGTTFNHRSTAYGENPLESAVSTDSFAQPLMQTEFPVDLLEVSMAGDVATVSWSPRERFGSDLNPIRSVNWESYRISYNDGTLEETFNSLTPTHTHDLAAYSGTVVISVSQVNRLTGPGPAKTVSVVV